RKTSRNRFSSPSAANNGTAPGAFIDTGVLRGFAKVVPNCSDHHAPARVVSQERLGSACKRDTMKTRFGNGEHDAIGHFLEGENNEGSRFGRVINITFDGVRMPSEVEEPLGFD